MRAAGPLLVLLALAGVLRFARVDEAPRGFYFDESAVALNARCIVEGGHDQYGERWPFFFRALDDWKDPIFLYGVAAWSLVDREGVWAARRFAALCGTLSILAAWLLAREVLGPGRGPLLVAGLLAVSPWHLQYSRIAWQAITLVLLHTLAAWALLRAARLGRAPGATGALAAGGALLGLVLWTYSPAKLWVPLLGGAFLASAIGFARAWPWSARATLAGAGAFVLAALPFLLAYGGHFDEVNLRFASKSVFTHGDGWVDVVRGWAAHLSPGFLFGEGDPLLRHSPPGVGQLLVVEAPLLSIGLVALWRDRTAASRLVVLWILLAPLLGAFTTEVPHATRTIALLPALQLAVARGVLVLVRVAGARAGLMAAVLALALGAAAGHATWAHFTAPARTAPWVWRPHATRVIETARQLQREKGALGGVHFLDANVTDVTYVDWLHVTRVPVESLRAQAELTQVNALEYDPFDSRRKFEVVGATFFGAPPPDAIVVQAPDEPRPELGVLIAEDAVSGYRYWRAP